MNEIIREVLQQNVDVLFAYLFGSMAQGQDGPRSDIDIALYFAEDVSDHFERGLTIHGELCRKLKTDRVDVILLNKAHNLMLIDEIIRQGTVILDRNKKAREDFEISHLHRAMDFKQQRLSIIGV